MNQFYIYLRAELGKLRHFGDAERFIENVPHEILQECNLAMNGDDISRKLKTQEAVDQFVVALPSETAKRLAEACSKRWRNNDVFDKLQSSDTWQEADVKIEQVILQQAEPNLGELFRAHGYSLHLIANDERILTAQPYCHHRPGEKVPFLTCLAMKRGEIYCIFDGMHRAIQLVRNGDDTLRLCYATNG